MRIILKVTFEGCVHCYSIDNYKQLLYRQTLNWVDMIYASDGTQ